jgi:lipopolysaccharide export system permease protein
LGLTRPFPLRYVCPVRVLNRYILETFVVTFTVTLVMVTFILCLGGMFQIVDLITRGFAWKIVLRIFAAAIPMALSFAIPITIVTTTLLVFERFSGDSEITAMKACGISIWQIVSRPVLWAILLTCICLYINTTVAARCHYFQKKTVHDVRSELLLKMVYAGRFVDFPGLSVYIGTIEGEDITNIIIYDERKDAVRREIRAPYGTISTSEDGRYLVLNLQGKVRIDPLMTDKPGAGFMTAYTVKADLAALTHSEYEKRTADLTSDELIEGILAIDKNNPDITREQLEERMALSVELNERMVISLSCMAFVLLGIPFGIKTRRASSSVGIGISLGLVFCFYLFIVLVDALARQPQFRPDLIIWTPIVVSVPLGLFLLRRQS